MTPMPGPIISARSLVKSFPSGDGRIEVLRGVDLEVAPGESVSIRGESGSGKSTLLNLFAALDAPDSGEIVWDGSSTLSPRRRSALLGIVFQSFYLVPELDARANVLMPSRIAGRVDREARARADELLAKVGLGGRLHHLPNQLSGGERQRVALARALMNRPKLILADEPTGNLDEHTGETVMNLLLSLCAETSTALVLVTHNEGHAARTDRQVRLHDGRFVPVA